MGNEIEKFKKRYFNKEHKSRKNNYKDEKDMKYAVRKAYFDMAPRTFIKINKDVSINKEGKLEVLGWLEEHIKNYLDNPNLCADYDKWHKETCEKFCEKFYKQALKNNYEKIKFGKGQKIVNMTMKYLYCFDDTNKADFLRCHMPLDRYVLDWFFDKVCSDKKNVRIPWSNFEYGSSKEEGTYMWYQKKIREYFEEQNKNPFIEEFSIWEEYSKKSKGKYKNNK